MSYRELTMIDVKEVLRRWTAGQTVGQIGRATGTDRKTVARYVAMAKALGVGSEHALDDGAVHRIRIVGRRGDDQRAPLGMRGQDTSVPDRMQLRRRHRGAKPTEQRQRIQIDGDGAVAERPLEGDPHQPIRTSLYTLGCDGRAQYILQQRFASASSSPPARVAACRLKPNSWAHRGLVISTPGRPRSPIGSARRRSSGPAGSRPDTRRAPNVPLPARVR
jgi:hypothetical protein